MTQHIMVDLETWSTKSNGLIISIGAVKFSLDEDVTEKSDAFHVGIFPNDFNGSFHIDTGTIGWWMQPEQREALDAWNGLEKTDLQSALTALIMWMNPATPTDVVLWGNGAAFDNVLLRHAFDRALGPGAVPWRYTNDRCYRTYRALTNDVEGPKVNEPPSMGTSHTALADALWQAAHLQNILRVYGLPLV